MKHNYTIYEELYKSQWIMYATLQIQNLHSYHYLNSQYRVVFENLVIIQAVKNISPFTKSKGPLNPIPSYSNLAYVLTSFPKFLFNSLLPSMPRHFKDFLSLFPNDSFKWI